MNKTLSIKIRQFFWPLLFGSASLLAQPAIAQTTGALRFLCSGEAENATVFINEKNMGQCPFDIEVPSGRQEISVSKPTQRRGFERRFETQFELGPGAARRVEVTLGGEERPTRKTEELLATARKFYNESVDYSRTLTFPLDDTSATSGTIKTISPDGRYFAFGRKNRNKKWQAELEIWDIESKLLVGKKEIVDITFVEKSNGYTSNPVSNIYGAEFSLDSTQLFFIVKTALERPVDEGGAHRNWLFSQELWKFEIPSMAFFKVGANPTSNDSPLNVTFSPDRNFALLDGFMAVQGSLCSHWAIWNVKEGKLLREIHASDILVRDRPRLHVFYLSNTGDLYARADQQRHIALHLKVDSSTFSQINIAEGVFSLRAFEHRGRVYFVGKTVDPDKRYTRDSAPEYLYLFEAKNGRILEKHRLSYFDKALRNFNHDFSFSKTMSVGEETIYEVHDLDLAHETPSFKTTKAPVCGNSLNPGHIRLYQHTFGDVIMHSINGSIFCINKIVGYFKPIPNTDRMQWTSELSFDPFLPHEDGDLYFFIINSLDRPKVISFDRQVYEYSQSRGRRGSLKSTSIEVWALRETNYGSIERVK